MASPGWSATLTDLLGAPVFELTAEDIQQLVADQVHETDELDFKATLYAKDESDKVELCKDVAGLRNHRGGVIVLGVGDKDAVANGCPEVALSDAEQRRMRQIVASGTAPHAAFEIREIRGKTDGKGFYLLVCEPSPQRPHAVLVEDGLRYPRRDGTTTRYLTEPEVADMYRSRFRSERVQTARLEQIDRDTFDRLDRREQRTWLVVSLVPNMPGSLPISAVGRTAIEQWAHGEHHNQDLVQGFFAELPARAGVNVERYILTSPADQGKPSNYPYAECFTDGSASAAVRVRVQMVGPPAITGSVILAPNLVLAAARALRFVARHALRAGARGDAVARAHVSGSSAQLGTDHGGIVSPFPGGVRIDDIMATATLPLDELGKDPQALFAATRLLLAPIFHAFGSPEVPQITPDGALRVRLFPPGYQVADWAEQHGVATSEEDALG